jgi:hypothetical protein
VFYSLPIRINEDENFILLNIEKTTERNEIGCEYTLTLKINQLFKKEPTIQKQKCGISFIMESHYNPHSKFKKNKYLFSNLNPSTSKKCFRIPLNMIDIPIKNDVFSNYLSIFFFLKELLPIIDLISLITTIIIRNYSMDFYNYIDHPLLDNL